MTKDWGFGPFLFREIYTLYYEKINMKGDLNHVLGWNCYCDVYRWRIRNGIDLTLHSWLKKEGV